MPQEVVPETKAIAQPSAMFWSVCIVLGGLTGFAPYGVMGTYPIAFFIGVGCAWVAPAHPILRSLMGNSVAVVSSALVSTLYYGLDSAARSPNELSPVTLFLGVGAIGLVLWNLLGVIGSSLTAIFRRAA